MGKRIVRAFAVDKNIDKWLVEIADREHKTISAVINALLAYALKHYDDPELQTLIKSQKTVFTKPPGTIKDHIKRLLNWRT